MSDSKDFSRKLNRKGLELTLQSMLGIFLVIFVAVLLFTVLRSRASTLSQQGYFANYESMDRFLIALLNSPHCFNYGGEAGNEATVQAILSEQKLGKLHNRNMDLWCINNFQFLYTIDLRDTENLKQWRIGIQDTEPPWAERITTYSLPAAIAYEDATLHIAEATLTVYHGPGASFYTSLKRACVGEEEGLIRLELPGSVHYTGSNNSYCIGSSCFAAAFPCSVRDFSLSSGRHAVYLQDRDHAIQVIE